MSLDVTLTATRPTEVFSANITHNLGKMAEAAGLYQHLWRPSELNITKSKDLIIPLALGLAKLRSEPELYQQYNAPNGWGKYDDLVSFVEQYLQACINNPDAEVHAWR